MYYIQYLDERDLSRCGSEASAFIRLKTLRGVINRVRRYAPKWAKKATLSYCTEETKYNDLLVTHTIAI